MTKTPLILSLLLVVTAGAYLFMVNKEQSQLGGRPLRIVAFGDSLTAGYGVSEEENYPSQLVRSLSKYQIEMINLGVNGDTSLDAKNRLQDVINEKPDIVLLGIGGNDALRLLPPAEAKENIGSIIQTLRSQPNPPRIILLEMKAGLHGGLDYKREFDAIYEELAEQYDLPLVPFVITNIYLDQKYVLSDRIHMNSEGYGYVVREYLKDAVEKEIKRMQK